MGPSRVNPLTGQILDADVTVRAPLVFLFSYHAFRAPLKSFEETEGINHFPGKIDPWTEDNLYKAQECTAGILEMLAQGKIKDIEDVPEEYIYDALKSLSCHEVGHTLGLRHNFKGSMTIPLKQIHNSEYTSKNSIGNSIMEYLPCNVAPKGVKQGDYFQKTIGVWDYWAIEYGYRPIEGKTPENELPVLQKIACRASEPELIYGTDEDAYDMGQFSSSIDPSCKIFDMSDDPFGYTEQSIGRIKDLWNQLEDRILFKGYSYVYLRKAFISSLSRYFSSLERLTKWIGGIYHTRVHVGDPGQMTPYRVVEYEKQKLAFDLIKTHLFAPDAFSFSPSFIEKLQIDRFVNLDTWSNNREASDRGSFRMDFSLSQYMKQYYKTIMKLLYDPLRLHRIQDNEIRARGKIFRLDDYLQELQNSVWKDIDKIKTPSIYQRILQREHLLCVQNVLLDPPLPMPEDAAAICRHQLKRLVQKLQILLKNGSQLDLMTQAHIENCLNIIYETLKASYTKIVK